MNGICPSCNKAVVVKKTVKVGYLVGCKACGAGLEIVSLKPLELDWSLDDYEDDYGDDDNDEEDDDWEDD